LHKSRHNLESSKAQHVTLKMYREEEVNSDQVDYRRRDSFREKLYMFDKEAIACIAQIE